MIHQSIQSWFKHKQIFPFSFQEETWKAIEGSYNGLVIAPTGLGKTFSVFVGIVNNYLTNPAHYKDGLKLIWVTPLRSLAKDIARAMLDFLEDIGLDWQVGVRNGDTSIQEKKGQVRHMPDVLIVTPESLHLLFAQKENTRFFKNLNCIAVDEWHELMGSKRGILVELAVSRLRFLNPTLLVWGISATIGNIEDAATVLSPSTDNPHIVIKAAEKKSIDIITILPHEIEILPWAGHLGTKMAATLLPIIEQSRTTLIFTNTRGQAELWYQVMLDVEPSLAGLIAIHHGSIDMELRRWIEDAIHDYRLKAVICTSSLDLGVDFRPVDTVIQIGSPKGVARFLQRAGRSGHSPFETSRIYFLPTHSLELVEASALKEAATLSLIESKEPLILCFDVLIQYLITLAVGEGFTPQEVFAQIIKTHAYKDITRQEWEWCLTFITQGGEALGSYEEFHKVIIENGIYKVTGRRIAMLHRLNIGVIVSETMLKVKFMGGGYVGMIEEYFISRLKPGDAFILAGKILDLVAIKDMTVIVKKSSAKKAITPSWMGGRLPLSSNLSNMLRKKFTLASQPHPVEDELKILQPLLEHQKKHSYIPGENDFLIELIDTKDGYHLFMYPFEGRMVHEVMAALVAYRLSLIKPISFSIAMNDYGFELLSDQPIPITQENARAILSNENLLTDINRSINAAEMARRKFRDIAVVAGLIYKNYAGAQKKDKNLQSTAGIIFKVFEEYDSHNLLIKQAYDEVFYQQLEEPRLAMALQRIESSQIVIKKATAFTPLSFPIKVDSLRENLTSEELEDRIKKMKEQSLSTNDFFANKPTTNRGRLRR